MPCGVEVFFLPLQQIFMFHVINFLATGILPVFRWFFLRLKKCTFFEKKSLFSCVVIYKCVFLQSQNKQNAMKVNELERKLKAAGCWFVKHGKRHDIWFSPITNKHFPIPRHGAKEVPNGTLSTIENESGVKL